MAEMKRRIAKNTTALLATRVINQIAGFILVVYATRRLGVEDFGKYSFVIAFYLVFELISFFGLANFLPREIGRHREAAGKYFLHAGALVGAGALVLVGVMNGVGACYGLPADAHLAVVICSFALLPAALGATAEAAFIGIERAEFITLLTFVKRLLVTGCSVAALARGGGVIALVIVRAAAEFATALLTVPLAIVQTRAAGTRWDGAFARSLLKGAAPFAALAILASVYWRLDVLLLQRLRGAAEVGIYSASYRLMFLLTLIPESFMNAAYPNLARRWKEDRAAFGRLAERALRYLVALALPAAAGAFVLARPVVLLIYEADFARSVQVFAILIFAVVPIYLNNVYYRALFAAERQLRSILILVVNIAAFAVAGLLLIPRWGAPGAAAALLISLGVAFAQNYATTFALVYRSKLGGAFIRSAAAAALMAAAVWFLWPHLPGGAATAGKLIQLGRLGLGAALGVVIYAPLLVLGRVVGRDDARAMREILAGPRAAPPADAA
jgi:O-antigen/teichoic acid export membrane protein